MAHQKTNNGAQYTPPLEALKYARSKTDFPLCAGGVDMVNSPFKEVGRYVSSRTRDPPRDNPGRISYQGDILPFHCPISGTS